MKKLLYFSADWCQPCNQLGAVMEKVSQFAPVQKINIDNNKKTAERYGVRNIPTVILIREDGIELARKVGVNPKQIYIDMYNQN